MKKSMSYSSEEFDSLDEEQTHKGDNN